MRLKLRLMWAILQGHPVITRATIYGHLHVGPSDRLFISQTRVIADAPSLVEGQIEGVA